MAFNDAKRKWAHSEAILLYERSLVAHDLGHMLRLEEGRRATILSSRFASQHIFTICGRLTWCSPCCQ